MYQDDLVKLSKEELIALALAQTAQIEELTRRIADLEAKLGGPPKTPDNSSLPPSQARKPNRAARRGSGYELWVWCLAELCVICIDEGGIASMLPCAETPFGDAARSTAAEVRSSKVVASEETSARVEGKNWWQWVLLSSTAVHHLIADSRGAVVLSDFLGETKPDVWVADRYAAPAGHGNERQLCLAHLLRDAQYAIDAGDTGFAPGFQKLLRRAIAIGQRRSELKDTTLAQYRADLDRKLDRLLAVSPTTKAVQHLARGIRKCRRDLFVFITPPVFPPPHTTCERASPPHP